MMCDTLAQMYINRVEWYLIDKYDVYVSFDSDGADEYWFDPMDIEDAPERTALRVFDEAIESIDADALKNLTAAISSLALNHGYTIDDVVDVLEANENSGVSVAMKDDEVVATRELEECGYPEEEEEEPPRYFKI